MPRPSRIHYEGAIYHVMLRGNDKQDIFFEEGDLYKFCFFLQEAIEKYNCKVHAYCFMQNHIHLAMQVSEIPLSKIMHNITFRYTQWINKAYDRVGHLFQGRFKAILVDSNPYLLQLIRYIHLNPLKANLINLPNDPWWSSHHDYMQKTQTTWITTDFVLSLFSDSIDKAVTLYENFIHADLMNLVPDPAVDNFESVPDPAVDNFKL